MSSTAEAKRHLHYDLNTIEEAIEDIEQGKIIIVVDDEDRENEGDFVCAAECITPEIINFMSKYGRGLICTPLDEARADELNLDMMVSDNTALHETAFTISVDLKGRGCTTGISAYDRATGIKALVDPEIKAEDFARPGHIFPLRAKTGGVLRRTGHTEAAIDLARLAGYYPAGVLVEILNEDGSMARMPQLATLAEEHDLKIITIRDLVAYRLQNERLIEQIRSVQLDSKYGTFEVVAYRQKTSGDIHLALKMGTWNEGEPVVVRVHSTSETGDIIGMLFDDYAEQLQRSMEKIAEEGKGVLLYMRQHEKENTLLNKLESRVEEQKNASQEKEVQRDFGVGAQILRDLGIRKLRLLTSHPKKRIGLSGYGLDIVETIDVMKE